MMNDQWLNYFACDDLARGKDIQYSYHAPGEDAIEYIKRELVF